MFVLRPMYLRDLPQVMQVNQRCFTYAWSERVFRLELSENPYSHWVVVEANDETPAPPRNRIKAFFMRGDRTLRRSRIIGFGGFWLINGEAHISNIGIDPDFRGRSLGEVLLLTMLKGAMSMGAQWSSLEVRVTNRIAINLYKKYQYTVAARRAAYYRDNHEDAFWMTVKPLDADYGVKLEQFVEGLTEQVEWKDEFSRKEAG